MRWGVALVTAGGFTVALAGCADMIKQWPKQLNLTPPPSAQGTAATPAKPASVSSNGAELATPEHREHEPASAEAHAASSRTASPASAKAHSAAAVPAPKPTVTLSGEASSREQAEKLLNAAQSTLSGVDETKLTGENRVTYAQANNFVGAAQKALQVRDYVTAAGLAKKASLLADEVKTTAPPALP